MAPAIFILSGWRDSCDCCLAGSVYRCFSWPKSLKSSLIEDLDSKWVSFRYLAMVEISVSCGGTWTIIGITTSTRWPLDHRHPIFLIYWYTRVAGQYISVTFTDIHEMEIITSHLVTYKRRSISHVTFTDIQAVRVTTFFKFAGIQRVQVMTFQSQRVHRGGVGWVVSTRIWGYQEPDWSPTARHWQFSTMAEWQKITQMLSRYLGNS